MGGFIDYEELEHNYLRGRQRRKQPCGCPEPWPEPDFYNRCILTKPLMIVIPPEGIHFILPGSSKRTSYLWAKSMVLRNMYEINLSSAPTNTANR